MDSSNSATDTFDWRTGMPPDARERIVSKITDTLKKHLPHSGEEGLNELKKIAEKFEENIYSTATSQSDYLRKISLKMLAMETGDRNSILNDRACGSDQSLGVGSLGMNNQVQPPTMPLQPPQPQSFQPLMPQTMQNQTRVQISPLFSSSARFSPIQNSMPNLIPQNPNNMQTSQNAVHMIQQNKAPLQQQQPQQQVAAAPPSMMAAQPLQQPQPQQQQIMSQMQPQQQQQQQLGLQQQQNPMQRDMAQRIQTSAQNPGSLIQAQSVMDPQKQQLYQAQRGVPKDTASTALDSTAQTGLSNGGDWQEEVYQKMKHIKEQYLPELTEMYQKIANKLMQHDSLPQQPKSEQFEKLKLFKSMLERAITFLQVPKSSIQPGYKEKLVSYERQIINFVNTNKPRKDVPQMQQQQQPQPGQLPSSHMLPQMQQQPPQPSQQSQISQVQPLENQQMNPQMQSMSSQGGSMPTMQPSNMSNLQQNFAPPQQRQQHPQQQKMMSSMQQQPNPGMYIVGQGNVMTNPMQQPQQPELVPVSSVQQQQQQEQQNPGGGPQLASMSPMSSQNNSINPMQQNMNAIQQTNSVMLQHPHIKQEHQQIMQNQQFKQQYHQRQHQMLLQIQHQMLLQIQQQLQQQQQAKQIPGQLQAHQNQIMQNQQIHPMSDIDNEMKMRQQTMGVKMKSGSPNVMQQQRSAGYPMNHQQQQQQQQQMKSGSPFSIASSPQLSQHPSPQQLKLFQQQLLHQQKFQQLQLVDAQQRPQAATPSVRQNPISLLPGTSAVPLATFPISAGQIGRVNGAEWQDEIYRKIKLMKDLYLPELLELQLKITTSLQRYDSLPKNEESELLESLKLLKFMLEKAISFLEVSKLNISEKYKNNQELVLRERQIMNFVNMNQTGNLFSQMPQPPTTGCTVWAAEHQAKQQVQIPPVPQSLASSLFSRVLEAATKIRSEKKSLPLSEPLFSDGNSVTGFGVSSYWVVLGLALMVFVVMFLAVVPNIVVLFSA